MITRFRSLSLLALALGAFAAPAFAAGPATFDKDYVGKMNYYTATYEDTLVHLARKYGLGFVEMRAANPTLDPWIPGAGAHVVLPTQHILPDGPRTGILINLPEMRLYYFQVPGQPPLTYSISPGREGLYTPIGTTQVMSKRENPTWTPTPRMLKEDPTLKPFYPAGPDNPLGDRAMYLGFPDIRIHGTNKPYAIGRLASSGCIRMYPESIRDLYPRVPVGTQVTVINQPVKVGWIDGKMYVSVSPTLEQSTHVEEEGEFKSYEITADDMRRITAKAGPYADNIDWEAVRTAVREHRGYPVAVLDKKGVKGARVKDDVQAELEAEALKDQAAAAKKEPVKAAPAVPHDQVDVYKFGAAKVHDVSAKKTAVPAAPRSGAIND